MARGNCSCGGTPLHRRIRELRGEGGHKKTRTGTVTGIHEHYDDKSVARIDLEELGLRGTKAENKAATATLPKSRFDKQFTVEVPKHHTAGLKLGDRVRVHTTIEKA